MPIDPRLDGVPGNCIRVPAVLDKQLDATTPEDRVLDLFGLPFPQIADDLIPTDAENAKRSVGRRVSGLNVSGALSQPPTSLNNVLTVDELAYSRDEVVTSEIGTQHRHVAPYPSEFSHYDPSAPASIFTGTNNECVLGTHVPLPDVYSPWHQNPLGGASVDHSYTLVAPWHESSHCQCLTPRRNLILESRMCLASQIPFFPTIFPLFSATTFFQCSSFHLKFHFFPSKSPFFPTPSPFFSNNSLHPL